MHPMPEGHEGSSNYLLALSWRTTDATAAPASASLFSMTALLPASYAPTVWLTRAAIANPAWPPSSAGFVAR
jgi:hypothetical protein